MGNLKYGDISTKDMDLVIQFPPTYDFPERDSETFHVPGRSGDLVISNDSFKNTTRSYSLASVFRPGTDFVANSERIIAWLTANPGYHRLEDSYDPEVYRIAMFKSKGSLQNYYDRATILNITFDCKPQRYLKTGEKVIAYSGAEVASLEGISFNIENPTLYKSLPEITLKNLDNSNENVVMFNIINYKGEMTSSILLEPLPSNVSSISFDSEHQLVYTIQNGVSKNLNKYVNFNGKPFPGFERSQNTIEIKEYNPLKNNIQKYNDLIDNKKDVLFAKYLPFETVLESKQSYSKIPSFKSIKNSNMEVYNAEAYSNLALDSSEYFEFVSFNQILDDNMFMVSFNTDWIRGGDQNKINTLSMSGSPATLWLNGFPINQGSGDYDIRTIDDTIAVFKTRVNKYAIVILRPQNDPNKQSPLLDGAFVKLKNMMDRSYDSNKIIHMNSVSLETLKTRSSATRAIFEQIYQGDYENDLVETYVRKGISTKSLNDLPSPSEQAGHDIVISLYPATKTDNKYYLNIDYDIPSFMDIDIIYSDNTDVNCSIDTILYVPTKTGYYYKPSSNSGGGILSSLISTATSVIGKLFNKTGWNLITVPTGDALEKVEWDSNKKAFVLGSLLSSNENYVVARYFIDAANLPQYQDEVLSDVYELDDKGNVKTDIAGNKIHKVIKNKIEIGAVNDDLSEISSVKILISGYYMFNDDENHIHRWKYYEEGDFIPSTDPDFNFSSKSSNQINYLADIPNYKNVKDFPEWLDPYPILIASNGHIIPDNPATANTRINAPAYSFKVTKTGWYWYEFVEDDITKRTVFIKLNSGDIIQKWQPDPADIEFDSDNDAKIYFMNYKVDSDEFPIHDYEYVQIKSSSVYSWIKFILNQDCDAFDPTKTYQIDDYIKYDDNFVYKCIQSTNQPPSDIQGDEYWKYIGSLITAYEYDPDHTYEDEEYCIYNRKLYRCSDETSQNPDDDTHSWTYEGEYVKNIGFYYLDVNGEEQEIPFNVLPDWIYMDIIRGDMDDFSDTSFEFIAIQNGLYKWDSNTDWLTKNADDVIVTSTYKSDTMISYMDELPEYNESEYDNLFDLSEIQQNANGNPEKVIIKVNQDGFYKIGNSNNYEYHKANSVLKELNVNQDIDIVYLDPQTASVSFSEIEIDIIPRWWSL